MGKLNGCTADTVRCPSARDYTKTTNPCCVGHVNRILRDLGDVLTDAGVRWWADYGTLLGAARHQGMVPWDKDGDISAPMKDWDKAQPAFRKLRDTYNVSVNHNRHSAKIRVSALNTTNVDVFFWWLRSEDGIMYRRRYARVDRYKGREFPEGWLYPLTTLKYEDMDIPVPKEWEKLLEHRYGSWQTPIRANNDGQQRGDYEGGANKKQRIIAANGLLRKGE